MAFDDSFGNQFKQLEREYDRRLTIPDGGYLAVRIDGRAFHTLTAHMGKPFDMRFIHAMNAAALEAVTALEGRPFAYVQSDEISVIYRAEKQLPFNGRVQKITTILASAATLGFTREYADQPDMKPMFDARAFTLPDTQTAQDYLSWRRLDCMRNVINMCANSLYTPQQLNGKTTRERWTMLQNTQYARIDDNLYYGRIIRAVGQLETITYTDKRTGQSRTVQTIRHHWRTYPGRRDIADIALTEGAD